ncbi:MAG: ABC transporter substrate-binding protein [Chloroflexota bacterium]|nr:ABC transporter substrate-binding protein [Chloroflexota bacterium]
MNRIKRVGIVLLSAAIIFGLLFSGWGCAKEEVVPPEKPQVEKPPVEKPPTIPPTIKVGMLAARTGSHAYYGFSLRGIKFVLDEINAAGGIKSMGGAKIEMVYGDTESNLEKVRGEFERLATLEKVDFMFFPSTSSESMAGMPIYDVLKVPVMATAASSKSVFEVGSYYYRSLSILSDDIAKRMVDTLTSLIEEYGIKHDRISVVTSDWTNTLEYREVVLKLLKKAGLDKNIVLDVKIPAKPTEAMMSSIVLKVKNSKPDVVLLIPNAPTGPLWFRAAYEVKFYPPLYIDALTWIHTEKAWDALGEEMAMDLIGKRPDIGYSLFYEEAPYKPWQDFRPKYEAFAKEEGFKPILVDYLGVQAALILKHIWEETGSKDREVVNEALHQVKLPFGSPDMVFPAWSPYLEFSPGGAPLHGTPPALQWQGHNLKCVYPKELRNAEPMLS